MQIVTDSAMDLYLPEEQTNGVNITVVPQLITLEGKTYRSGVDISSARLYQLLASTRSFPVTSLPSVSDFTATYRRLAAKDPDILSIHVCSDLSGTFNTARIAADMTPEANITLIDSRSLSVVLGWQVAAAARAIHAGWAVKPILEMIEHIHRVSEILLTMDDLRYLIHGGRVGHLKGLLASVLNIRPLLCLDHISGKLNQLGLARTFKGALNSMLDWVAKSIPLGSDLRVQAGHSNNPQGMTLLREKMQQIYRCHWLPDAILSPVVGAHAGPTLVGMAYAPESAFKGIP